MYGGTWSAKISVSIQFSGGQYVGGVVKMENLEAQYTGKVRSNLELEANIEISASHTTEGEELLTKAGPQFQFSIYGFPIIITTTLTLEAYVTFSASVNMTIKSGMSLNGALTMGGRCTTDCVGSNYQSLYSNTLDFEYQPPTVSSTTVKGEVTFTAKATVSVYLQDMVGFNFIFEPYIGFSLENVLATTDIDTVRPCPGMGADSFYDTVYGFNTALSAGDLTTPTRGIIPKFKLTG